MGQIAAGAGRGDAGAGGGVRHTFILKILKTLIFHF